MEIVVICVTTAEQMLSYEGKEFSIRKKSKIQAIYPKP